MKRLISLYHVNRWDPIYDVLGVVIALAGLVVVSAAFGAVLRMAGVG